MFLIITLKHKIVLHLIFPFVTTLTLMLRIIHCIVFVFTIKDTRARGIKWLNTNVIKCREALAIVSVVKIPHTEVTKSVTCADSSTNTKKERKKKKEEKLPCVTCYVSHVTFQCHMSFVKCPGSPVTYCLLHHSVFLLTRSLQSTRKEGFNERATCKDKQRAKISTYALSQKYEVHRDFFL